MSNATSADEKFETWGLVEVMGHKRLAGFITEQTIAGSALVRVNVPETAHKPGYTKYVGVGSIYCLTPTTEEVARAIAETLERYNNPLPVELPRQLIAAGATADAEFEDDTDEDEADDDMPY